MVLSFLYVNLVLGFFLTLSSFCLVLWILLVDWRRNSTASFLPLVVVLVTGWRNFGIASFQGLVSMGLPQRLVFLCIFIIINHVGCSTSTLIFRVRVVCEEWCLSNLPPTVDKHPRTAGKRRRHRSAFSHVAPLPPEIIVCVKSHFPASFFLPVLKATEVRGGVLELLGDGWLSDSPCNDPLGPHHTLCARHALIRAPVRPCEKNS